MVAPTTSLPARGYLFNSASRPGDVTPGDGTESGYIQRINDLQRELRQLNILEHSKQIVEIYDQIQVLRSKVSKAIPD